MVLARLAAKRQVKAALAGQGIRVSMVRHSEIMERARAFLAEHPEVYAEAREIAGRLGMYQRTRRRRTAVSGTEPRVSATEVAGKFLATMD
jgi:hypothetical protein